MQKISFYLPDPTIEILAQLARKRGVPMGTVVRDALMRDYMDGLRGDAGAITAPQSPGIAASGV